MCEKHATPANPWIASVLQPMASNFIPNHQKAISTHVHTQKNTIMRTWCLNKLEVYSPKLVVVLSQLTLDPITSAKALVTPL